MDLTNFFGGVATTVAANFAIKWLAGRFRRDGIVRATAKNWKVDFVNNDGLPVESSAPDLSLVADAQIELTVIFVNDGDMPLVFTSLEIGIGFLDALDDYEPYCYLPAANTAEPRDDVIVMDLPSRVTVERRLFARLCGNELREVIRQSRTVGVFVKAFDPSRRRYYQHLVMTVGFPDRAFLSELEAGSTWSEAECSSESI